MTPSVFRSDAPGALVGSHTTRSGMSTTSAGSVTAPTDVPTVTGSSVDTPSRPANFR